MPYQDFGALDRERPTTAPKVRFLISKVDPVDHPQLRTRVEQPLAAFRAEIALLAFERGKRASHVFCSRGGTRSGELLNSGKPSTQHPLSTLRSHISGTVKDPCARSSQ